MSMDIADVRPAAGIVVDLGVLQFPGILEEVLACPSVTVVRLANRGIVADQQSCTWAHCLSSSHFVDSSIIGWNVSVMLPMAFQVISRSVIVDRTLRAAEEKGRRLSSVESCQAIGRLQKPASEIAHHSSYPLAMIEG
jgi:hypothetical protein